MRATWWVNQPPAGLHILAPVFLHILTPVFLHILAPVFLLQFLRGIMQATSSPFNTHILQLGQNREREFLSSLQPVLKGPFKSEAALQLRGVFLWHLHQAKECHMQIASTHLITLGSTNLAPTLANNQHHHHQHHHADRKQTCYHVRKHST